MKDLITVFSGLNFNLTILKNSELMLVVSPHPHVMPAPHMASWSFFYASSIVHCNTRFGEI